MLKSRFKSRRMLMFVMMWVLVLPLLAAACESESGDDGGSSSAEVNLHIVSGSENEQLEPIIQRWASDRGVNIQVSYLGSLDIMLDLEDGDIEYDAVWPANRIWLELGDERFNKVKHIESILRSPVVLGLKKSIAEDLGWVDAEVSTDDILAATEAGRFSMMMTSATQSNSGASAYFAFLYAFAGQPTALSMEDLQDPEVAENIRSILGNVNRSSGSSGWLKTLCLEQYIWCDGMINYEALIIEANQELVRRGDEPLYAIYPTEGLAIADSPLGYFDKGDADKEALFLELQAYLLSEPVQQEIINAGRRAGVLNFNVSQASREVFNPEWGIDIENEPLSIIFPREAVIREALNLYQTAFRKPSFTIYALDFSGSMRGAGEEQLKLAMRTLLDQRVAEEFLLQASADDINVILIFNDRVINGDNWQQWMVQGNDPDALLRLYQQVNLQEPGGGTDIYEPVVKALDIFEEVGVGGHFPAVILMTDGVSNEGSLADIQTRYTGSGEDIPVFSITFGEADRNQLDPIATLTAARVFNGQGDLVGAFRQAKGYN